MDGVSIEDHVTEVKRILGEELPAFVGFLEMNRHESRGNFYVDGEPTYSKVVRTYVVFLPPKLGVGDVIWKLSKHCLENAVLDTEVGDGHLVRMREQYRRYLERIERNSHQ